MSKRSSKPRVTTKCVANTYAAPDECIIEIGAGTDGAGCLVSIRYFADRDMLIVSAYNKTRVEVRS